MATIRKRNNKWETQVRIKGYQNKCKTFLYYEDAKKWAKEIERKIEQGTYIDFSESQQTTLGDLLQRYLNEVSPKKKSFRNEKYLIPKLMENTFTTFSIYNLTSNKLVEYRNERLKKVSSSTVNREISLISAVISKAREEWGINLPYNVGRLLKRLKEPAARERRLTLFEYKKLMDACSQSKAIWLQPLVKIALETGMRRGELLSLTRNKINLDKKLALLSDTKNGSSRTIPLSNSAIHIIENLPLSFNKKLFSITESSLKFYWTQALKRADIKGFCFHQLRHEAISRFFEKGLTIPEVALISGHKDVRMLFRYTHLKAEDILRKL